MADEGITAAEPSNVVARLKRRMVDEALPLWATVGWDHAAGGFIDRLHPDGAADAAAPRRVFVQARQIWCYAKAAQMGWYPEGRAIALKGLEHLLARAKAPDGRPGYVHRLTPEGSVLDARRDAYDTPSSCLRSRPSTPSTRTRRSAPRSMHCSPSSTAICARRMAAFTKAFRSRCRAGRTRICICSRR